MSGFGSLVDGFLKGWKAGDDSQTKKMEREYKKLRNKILQRKMDRDDADPSQADDEIKARKLKLQQMERTNSILGLRGKGLLQRLKENEGGGKGGLDPNFSPTPGGSTTKYDKTSSADDGAFNWADASEDGPGADEMNSTPASGAGLSQVADAAPEPAPTESAIPTEDTAYASRGGKIRSFAAGGMVDDEETDDEAEGDEPEAVTQTSAIPTDATSDRMANREVAGATDISARRRGYSATAAHDAVLTGISMGQKDAGLFGGVQTTNRGRMARYQSGAGGFSRQELEQLNKKVDPKNELSESERTMKVFGSVWQYYIAKGDVEAAKQAALKLTNSYRGIFNTYKNLMQAAASHGDLDNTMQAALKAYANVPNGQHARVHETKDGKLGFEVVDENGKRVSGIVGTPQEILQMATGGMASSMDFDKLVAGAAAQRANPTDEKAQPDVMEQINQQHLAQGTPVGPEGVVPPGSNEMPKGIEAGPPAAPAPETDAAPTPDVGDMANRSRLAQGTFLGPEDVVPPGSTEMPPEAPAAIPAKGGARAAKAKTTAPDSEATDAAYKALIDEMTPEPKEGEKPQPGPKVATADATTIKTTAAHLMTEPRNEHLLPSEVIATTAAMVAPDTFGTFKISKAKDGVVVKTKSNDPVFIPQARFDEIMAAGLAKKRAQDAAKAKADEEAAKPGVMSKIGGALGSALTGRDKAREVMAGAARRRTQAIDDSE